MPTFIRNNRRLLALPVFIYSPLLALFTVAYVTAGRRHFQ